jgi:Mn-containing catalase
MINRSRFKTYLVCSTKIDMFLSINKLPNNIRQGDKPDPKAAQALQEGLGGQFGEMRTMMQYLFQNMNFRGDAIPFKDLLREV